MSGVAMATFWWQYIRPSNFPGLEVWYYADDGLQFNNSRTPLANNTNVTSWQNAGGLSSHDWNSVGGKRPTYFTPVKNGKGVVRFSPAATSALTINPVAYMQSLPQVTMAIMFKSSNTGAGTRICTTTDTLGFRWGQNGTQWIGGFSGSTFTVNTLTADTNYHIIVYRFDGSQSSNDTRLTARLDSTTLTLTFAGTVGTTTSPTATTFFGGVDSTGNSGYWDGEIGEFMFWTTALTTSQILGVENYLKTKWSI